jgi:hypothetical protein
VPTIVLSSIEAAGCDSYSQKPISLDRLLPLLDVVGAATWGTPLARHREH